MYKDLLDPSWRIFELNVSTSNLIVYLHQSDTQSTSYELEGPLEEEYRFSFSANVLSISAVTEEIIQIRYGDEPKSAIHIYTDLSDLHKLTATRQSVIVLVDDPAVHMKIDLSGQSKIAASFLHRVSADVSGQSSLVISSSDISSVFVSGQSRFLCADSKEHLDITVRGQSTCFIGGSPSMGIAAQVSGQSELVLTDSSTVSGSISPDSFLVLSAPVESAGLSCSPHNIIYAPHVREH